MHWHIAPPLHRMAAAVLGLVLLLSIAPAMAQKSAVQPLNAGDFFPAGVYKVFNPRGDVLSIDLADLLEKRSIVLVYWIPGNARAEEVFTELLAVTRELDPERLAVLGIAVSNPGIGVTPDVIRERVAATGIDVPVLNDEGFVIGKRLQVRSVPHISIIDKSGRLKLSNGASLRQSLEYKVDIAAAIRRVAETGELYDYGYLAPYYPVRELEGQPAPDFTAPLVRDGKELTFSELLDDTKVNVLVFWSVDCPHCRRQLPEINDWIKANPEHTNLVGCITVANEKEAAQTREFCETSGFVFPNVVDMGTRIGRSYGVTTTPTIVIIGPDGVVNGAITSSVADFGSAMKRKRKELLGE